MLGRLRMSVPKCIEQYSILSKEIFGDRKNASEYIYSASNLEQQVKGVIRRELGEHAEDAPLQDPLQENACKW